jgi:hypothetical protein
MFRRRGLCGCEYTRLSDGQRKDWKMFKNGSNEVALSENEIPKEA